MRWKIGLYRLTFVLALLVVAGAKAENVGVPAGDGAEAEFSQAYIRPLPEKLFLGLHFQTGAVIPGLKEGAVPQGLAYARKKNLFLITAYVQDGKTPSQLFLVDEATGDLVQSFSLANKDGSPHFGHVGGVGTDGKTVWVASDRKVLVYRPFETVRNDAASMLLTAKEEWIPETRADYLTYDRGSVHVGEFYLSGRHETKPSHHLTNDRGERFSAWMAGYREGRVHSILATRDKVQGALFHGDRIYLSVSYGRNKRSRIEIHRNPMDDPPEANVQLRPAGEETGVWFLDSSNHLGTVDFPPMTEGITAKNGELVVLVESGANKYQTGGLGPVDFLIHLPMDALI